MKKTIVVLALLFSLVGLSQNPVEKPKRIVKTETQYINRKLYNYEENDKNGNMVFSKGDGVFAEGIKNLSATDYDDANRSVRYYSGHSNLGFSVSETVYENKKRKNYEYVADSLATSSYHPRMLDGIHTREEFLNNPIIQAILKSPKQLQSIEILNDNNDVISEIYLSDKGDTTGVNTYRYNDKNKEVFFQMDSRDSSVWNWDIHYLYDDRGNNIKSFRLEKDGNGGMDTTEIYHYTYDGKDQLLTSDYYNSGIFNNKTVYHYNKKGQLDVELFFDKGPDKPTVKQLYFYNDDGTLLKKITKDSRRGQKSGVEVYSRKITYW